MNRRDLLVSLGLAAAAAPLSSLEALTPAALCTGPTQVPGGRSFSRFRLSESIRPLVAAVAEVIIPQTDTAGAGGAGLVGFMEFMLGDWFTVEERRDFLDGLDNLERTSRARYGVTFASLDDMRKTIVFRALETDALTPDGLALEPKSFVSRLKLLILTGYYTSEVGASVELDNTMLFPSFKGCIPLGPDDRAQSNSVPAPGTL
jgi:hypothetical protein